MFERGLIAVYIIASAIAIAVAVPIAVAITVPIAITASVTITGGVASRIAAPAACVKGCEGKPA
jgi:hypothetical protein